MRRADINWTVFWKRRSAFPAFVRPFVRPSLADKRSSSAVCGSYGRHISCTPH